MRVLRRDAAQVVPHAGDDVLDLRVVEIEQSPLQVLASPAVDAEARSNRARQRACDGRGPGYRQEPAAAEEQPGSAALRRVEEPPNERSPARHGLPCG